MSRVRLYYIGQHADPKPVQLSKALITQWITELPLTKQAFIQRLLNDSDRISSLLGLRLLKQCAQDENVPDFKLSDIQYPDSGKPVWQSKTNHKFDFNISHSDNLVVVAASKKVKVGVDVEKLRELKRLNFKMVMLPEELEKIRETPGLFFDMWSKKEAVVKAADTAGIARMRDVMLKNDKASLDERQWHLKSVAKQMNLDNQFSVHLATSAPVSDLIIKHVLLDELIK